MPDPGEAGWVSRFSKLRSIPETYYPLVIVSKETDRIVAVGTLVMEFKFIRNLGITGHIEDIAVDPKIQGKGLGKRIIEALTEVSEALGAYKTILDCSDENQGECRLWDFGRQCAAYGAARTRCGSCLELGSLHLSATKRSYQTRSKSSGSLGAALSFGRTAGPGRLTASSKDVTCSHVHTFICRPQQRAAFYVKCGYVLCYGRALLFGSLMRVFSDAYIYVLVIIFIDAASRLLPGTNGRVLRW